MAPSQSLDRVMMDRRRQGVARRLEREAHKQTQQPEQDEGRRKPDFDRDRQLEQDRAAGRPAKADLNATE